MSGMGAPGTGAILMNPAGNIQTKEEVEQKILQTAGSRGSSGSNVQLASVAQVTASDSLPPYK